MDGSPGQGRTARVLEWSGAKPSLPMSRVRLRTRMLENRVGGERREGGRIPIDPAGAGVCSVQGLPSVGAYSWRPVTLSLIFCLKPALFSSSNIVSLQRMH